MNRKNITLNMNMKKYLVGISMINCFEVEAENEEQAEDIVRTYDLSKCCEEMDFNINYVDELDERDAAKKHINKLKKGLDN